MRSILLFLALAIQKRDGIRRCDWLKLVVLRLLSTNTPFFLLVRSWLTRFIVVFYSFSPYLYSLPYLAPAPLQQT